MTSFEAQSWDMQDWANSGTSGRSLKTSDLGGV